MAQNKEEHFQFLDGLLSCFSKVTEPYVNNGVNHMHCSVKHAL